MSGDWLDVERDDGLPMREHLVHVLGSQPPIVAVSFSKPPEGWAGNDSGFLIAFSDAPAPEELDEQAAMESMEEFLAADRWRTLGALVEEFPDVVQALELARWAGEVQWYEGRWTPLEDIPE